jgi:hypothetical protein
MRGRWMPVFIAVVAACSTDRTSPGIPPDVPANLASTSLDGAIALSWTDNSYTADPSTFENYRIYSTTYDLDNDLCGNSWALEGTTVAPEFVVGALTNGVSHCFAVTAQSIDGAESARSQARADTPRPDSRNVLLYEFPVQDASSGFRFWEDLNGDGQTQDAELGLVRDGSASSIDFVVERATDGTVPGLSSTIRMPRSTISPALTSLRAFLIPVPMAAPRTSLRQSRHSLGSATCSRPTVVMASSAMGRCGSHTSARPS